MTPERIGAKARPEHSGSSTIVSLPDMTAAHPTDTTALHELVLHSLDEDQAQDVVSIPLEGKSSIADHMVIASGRSTRQVAAIATHLAERLKKDGHGNPRIEGLPAADWVLIDAGDVVVHLFRPEVRSFYNLERMWGFGEDGAVVTGRA
jgi:ribosome-associated protein